MSQISNNKKIFILIISALVIVLAFLVFFIFNLLSEPIEENSPYSAVYLKTGDIYFGELSWFPRLKLKNPWFLQKTTDENNQPQIGVAPLAGAFWGPQNEIYLNQDEIIFWTRLRNNSQVIPFLSGGNNSTLQN